ncbi:MAG: hypothetical protein EOQ39_18735 [Mesorhizobium sp.]|uniref:hypothetical protein n=1 Tax=Mesorhizobium sp. TaxID=1871066 RepID=UPI000FE68C18|nr:hypothetical protein [Mesorhizobium sp.]RWB08792.1 MAG: hypothetical protein EOQ37_04605 [Mesorhizobium sp.]RWB13557.1 MAG: hypothetical protein EOQ39_18735 [Mesorhizobium sp.]
MASTLGKILAIVAPKKSAKKGGIAATGTYNPAQADRVLTAPLYQEHLTDIFASRQSDDSRVLLKNLFKTDPDVSAAVFSYLTMANTEPLILVRDLDGQIDRDQTKALEQAIKFLTVPTDYTLGFQLKKNLRTLAEEMRYMGLLRGAIGVELVLNDQLAPGELRTVDMSSVTWFEKKPGQFKPFQTVPGVSAPGVSLDIPTFFVSFFRRDPTEIYSYSTFVSSINTIAARQQVINDLYRIMQKTGYPRLDISLIEEVMVKNIPSNVKNDPDRTKAWLEARMSEVQTTFANMRPDQAFVHWDSVEPTILNDKNPGMGVDVSKIIETLNAQNQAGLKTMATVIGRGASGVNTSSVESRIAAMNADELNEPVAEILTNVASFILHQSGYQGFAEVTFVKAELRPDLELEPQLMLKSSRLRQDLSDGLITDDEYHLQMYRRLRPDASPELSGTKFAGDPGAIDASKASPNSDPLGRSLAAPGAKAAKSNGVKAALKLLLSEAA